MNTKNTTPNATQPSAMRQAARGFGVNYVFEKYQTQLTAILAVIAIFTVHFVSGKIGLGPFGDALFSLYLISFATATSISKKKIPFACGIQQPPVIQQPGLLDVLCAALSTQFKALFCHPSGGSRLPADPKSRRQIQPRAPTTRGIPVVLVRLFTTPFLRDIRAAATN